MFIKIKDWQFVRLKLSGIFHAKRHHMIPLEMYYMLVIVCVQLVSYSVTYSKLKTLGLKCVR